MANVFYLNQKHTNKQNLFVIAKKFVQYPKKYIEMRKIICYNPLCYRFYKQ